MRLVTKRETDM